MTILQSGVINFSLLRGYDLFEFCTGESQCPSKYSVSTDTGVTKEITNEYKEWVKKDLALLSLLIATLSDEAMDHIVGCKTSQEAWECLQERFASVSVVRVNQLTSEFHTIQKGTDSVDKYLLRLKAIRDQLVSAGEKITDNDFIIAAISGLPPEFEVIKTVILERDSCISLKDFRAQLLGAERYIESRMTNITTSMSALCVQGESSHTQGGHGCFQNYEHGEGSNSQEFQGFHGGSGFIGNIGNNFHPQQRNNFNSNNRRFYGNNNHTRSFSNFGNRQGNGYTDNGKSPQHGTNGANGSFSGNNNSGSGNNFSGSSSKQGNNWNGNTNYKSTASPECQICSRRGHTAPNYYQRHNFNAPSSNGFLVCQICGKKCHTALECYHRNNYAYQGGTPPQSLVGMTAQGPNIPSSHSPPSIHEFSGADTWVVDTGQGNTSDAVPRKE